MAKVGVKGLKNLLTAYPIRELWNASGPK